jgi:hypothetical protein
MAKRRPAFAATDTRNRALAADDDECACAAGGESTRGVQRPGLYIVLARALRQPAWQRPRRRGERVGGVRCEGAGPKARPLLPNGVRACTAMHVCARARTWACRGHSHGGDHNGNSDTAAGMVNAGKETKKKNERAARTVMMAAALQKSFPSLAQRLASPAACAEARWRTRHSPSARRPGHPRRGGKRVLTLVAPGRSVGVGEEERCGLVGTEEDDGRVQGKQRTKVCAATRFGSSFPDGSGSAKTARSHGRIPASFSSTPPLTSPTAGLGSELPVG